MEILLPEYKQMLLLLIKHDVKFMLVGGYAVIFHGYERHTTDMDVWLEPENTNRDKLLLALKEFGTNEKSLNGVAKLDFTKITFFQFGKRPRQIDFLTKVVGVSWTEAYPEVAYFPFGNEKIPIIQYYHLVRTKITNDRPQDKADIEMLHKINRWKKK